MLGLFLCLVVKANVAETLARRKVPMDPMGELPDDLEFVANGT